jgi:hypothetical protein
MHQKKADILKKLSDASRDIDDAARHVADVARHPDKHGWLGSVGAAIVGLPIVGITALALAASEVVVGRIPDADFQRDFPDQGSAPDAPPAT